MFVKRFKDRMHAGELLARQLNAYILRPDVIVPAAVGLDDVVIELNKAACATLQYEKQLAIVPAATHLFEEPGTLQTAAELARDWFLQYSARTPQSAANA